jgi:hypothetical protein
MANGNGTVKAQFEDVIHGVSGWSLSANVSKWVTASIPAGTALSDTVNMTSIELLGYVPAIIITPSNWTTANMSLQISIDEGTTWLNFEPWLSANYNTSATVVASRAHFMDNYPLKGVPYFRIRSGTAASPVNQTTTSILTIICTTI